MSKSLNWRRSTRQGPPFDYTCVEVDWFGVLVPFEELVEALAEDKLRGVALDVYVGEFDHDPDRRLWDDERILITPHISIGLPVLE